MGNGARLLHQLHTHDAEPLVFVNNGVRVTLDGCEIEVIVELWRSLDDSYSYRRFEIVRDDPLGDLSRNQLRIFTEEFERVRRA